MLRCRRACARRVTAVDGRHWQAHVEFTGTVGQTTRIVTSCVISARTLTLTAALALTEVSMAALEQAQHSIPLNAEPVTAKH